jgi:hypothetical protein
MIGIERLAIHPLGQNDLLHLEFSGDLTKRQQRVRAVSTENTII